MGNLELECAATDGVSLFAMAYGYDSTKSTKYTDKLILLLKSNPDPSSADNIVWSVVATIREDAFEELNGFQPLTMNCQVNSKGSFIVLAVNTRFPTNGPTQYVRDGFRYDPEGKGSSPVTKGNPTGPGKWFKVSAAANFVWNNKGTGMPLLFPVKNPATGGEEWIHALSNYTQIGLHISRLNSATDLFENVAYWDLSLTQYGSPNHLTFARSSSSLLVQGKKYSPTTQGTLFSIPFLDGANIPATLPTGLKTYTDTVTTDSFIYSASFSGVLGNTYYLNADKTSSINTIENLFVLDLSVEGAALSPPISIVEPKGSFRAMIPMAGTGGPGPFAFAMNGTGIYSIPLYNVPGGPSILSWTLAPYKVNVTEGYSEKSGSANGGGGGSGGGSGSSGGYGDDGTGMSPGGLVGIVFAVILALSLIAYRWYRYKRSRDPTFGDPPQLQEQQYQQQHIHVAPQMQEGKPYTPQFFPAHQQFADGSYSYVLPQSPAASSGESPYPSMQSPSFQTAPPDVVSTGPDGTQYKVQYGPGVVDPQHRAMMQTPNLAEDVQAHIQQELNQMRFSSHPQPTFVTSLVEQPSSEGAGPRPPPPHKAEIEDPDAPPVPNHSRPGPSS